MNLSNYPTTVRALWLFLNQCGVRIDLITLHNTFDAHPLPHSIRSLSDTLDRLGVSNMVCRITPQQLDQIPTPSIFFLKQYRDLFYIFKGINDQGEIVLQSPTKIRSIDMAEFCQYWDGYVLLAHRDENEHHTPLIRYVINQSLGYISQKVGWWISACFMAIVLWGMFGYNIPHAGGVLQDLLYLLHMVGLGVSTIILAKTYWDTSLMQGVCTIKKADECSETFLSKDGELFGWVSLGAVAWVYFFSSIIWGLFMTPDPLSVWLMCGTLGMGFVIYSVVWQLIKAKLCVWCLLIDLVLVCQWVVLLFTPGARWSELSLYPDFLTFGVVFAMMLLVVNCVCWLLKARNTNLGLIEKRERVLSDGRILDALLSTSPVVLNPDIELIRPITNNLKEYDHCVTVVLSPHCTHCAQAQKVISRLEGCRVEYILLTDDQGDDSGSRAAQQFVNLSILGEASWSQINKAMSRWYQNVSLPSESPEVSSAVEILKAHNNYCFRLGIISTPAIFIDGRELPDIYDASDLEYIL